jgi:hypothetical protein
MLVVGQAIQEAHKEEKIPKELVTITINSILQINTCHKEDLQVELFQIHPSRTWFMLKTK